MQKTALSIAPGKDTEEQYLTIPIPLPIVTSAMLEHVTYSITKHIAGADADIRKKPASDCCLCFKGTRTQRQAIIEIQDKIIADLRDLLVLMYKLQLIDHSIEAHDAPLPITKDEILMMRDLKQKLDSVNFDDLLAIDELAVA